MCPRQSYLRRRQHCQQGWAAKHEPIPVRAPARGDLRPDPVFRVLPAGAAVRLEENQRHRAGVPRAAALLAVRVHPVCLQRLQHRGCEARGRIAWGHLGERAAADDHHRGGAGRLRDVHGAESHRCCRGHRRLRLRLHRRLRGPGPARLGTQPLGQLPLLRGGRVHRDLLRVSEASAPPPPAAHGAGVLLRDRRCAHDLYLHRLRG
mmetsp:Transcript_66471/g.187252  ORF Transcript_66471/g.187252 Transcript_66471/m.187252 type:complete len:206 (-) Transcript_66471:618-1235(-)